MEAQLKSTESFPSSEEKGRESWHLLNVESVLQHFQTDPTLGLTPELAQKYLSQFGPNQLPKIATRSSWEIALEQFKSTPVALLSVAALIALLTGSLSDALVIMVVVLINAVIGTATESHSDRIIRSLEQFNQVDAQVLRDGVVITLAAQAVVPGDLLMLQLGLPIVADARVIAAAQLSLDESLLTGESIPVAKTVEILVEPNLPLGDRQNMVYQGTRVVAGQGMAVVVATGQHTEMGQLQALVGQLKLPKTPIEHQLDQLGSQLVVISSAICGLVFAIGLLRGYAWLEMLKTSISLAVAAVPEGLPAVATTTLALGIWSMQRHKILIRRLDAIETLGAIQSLCLDKTGTLTENRMSVVELCPETVPLAVQAGLLQSLAPSVEPLLRSLVLCNDSDFDPTSAPGPLQGSATESALLQWAIDVGMDVRQIRANYPRIKTQYRTTEHNWMMTLHQTPAGDLRLVVKGNPLEVLSLCDAYWEQGQVMRMTPARRQQIGFANEQMADRALRVLGVAFGDRAEAQAASPTPLTWVGLVGLADPIRAGVPDAIQTFHRAGIETIMVTGDQSRTAYAIGQLLDLSQGQPLQSLTGAELGTLDAGSGSTRDHLWDQVLQKQIHIFARISPSHKLQIVQALQKAGKVVAMTGDGINDSLALKAANVGIVMGRTGTDAAREVADVVLEEDDLGTVAIAIQRGRTIYNNIRKSVHFLLATNLSEILVMLVSTIVGIGQPLNAMQLLWLNLVTDIFPGLALALEAPEGDVLQQPPRAAWEPIIPGPEFRRILVESGVLSISALSAYSYVLWQYGLGNHASTVGFMSLTLAQLLHAVSCRSKSRAFLRANPLPANPYLALALVGSITLQLVTLAIPQVRQLLHLTSLSWLDLGIITVAAFVPLLINDFTKSMPTPLRKLTLPE